MIDAWVKANQLANFPLNFLRTGYYHYSNGQVYARTSHGIWWLATRRDAASTYDLYTGTTDILPQYSGNCAYGFALSCGEVLQLVGIIAFKYDRIMV